MTKINKKVENPNSWDKNVVIGVIGLCMNTFFGVIGIIGAFNRPIAWDKVLEWAGLGFFILLICFVFAWIVIWFINARIQSVMKNFYGKDIRVLDVRTKKMTVEHLFFIESVLRRFDKKPLSNEERLERIAGQLGNKIKMDKQEATKLIIEGRDNMQKTLDVL